MVKTFKQINNEKSFTKKIVKHGECLGINFTKEDVQKFDLTYEDEINLDDAKIIKKP